MQGQRNHRNDFAWKKKKQQLHGGVPKSEGFYFYEIDFNWRNHENLFVNLVYYLKVAMEMCQMIWLGQSTNLLYQFTFFFWKIMLHSLRSIIFGTALKSVLFFVVYMTLNADLSAWFTCLLFENSVRPMMIFETANQFVIEDWRVFHEFLILSFSSLFSILDPLFWQTFIVFRNIWTMYGIVAYMIFMLLMAQFNVDI